MNNSTQNAIYVNDQVRLEGPVNWPEGTKLRVLPVAEPNLRAAAEGLVLIAGFGLAGRCVADLLDEAGLSYVVIERNPATVSTQTSLGRRVVEGNVCDAATLLAAGLHQAAILALTVPDEEAVLTATSLARKLRPNIYIIARTQYSSKGMQASQLGADVVIKAEQAVAMRFYEEMAKRIGVAT